MANIRMSLRPARWGSRVARDADDDLELGRGRALGRDDRDAADDRGVDAVGVERPATAVGAALAVDGSRAVDLGRLVQGDVAMPDGPAMIMDDAQLQARE